MAHRQSGGYKEEPGVAVAGDHVSTQPFPSIVTILSDSIIALVSMTLFELHSHNCFTSPKNPNSQAALFWPKGAGIAQGCVWEVWLRCFPEDHGQGQWKGEGLEIPAQR